MTALFADGSPAAADALAEAVGTIVTALTRTVNGPFPDLPADVIAAELDRIDPLPDDGVLLATVLDEVDRHVMAHMARPVDPRCAAHLHSPTLLTAAAAELAIGVTNQSMDSYDQAPAATLAEDRLTRRLARIIGLPPSAAGVFTAGGTASNLLGLTLARHRADPTAMTSGLPAAAGRWRIVTSTAAHASVRQAAAVLGLGRDAVIEVEVDEAGRMSVSALDRTLGRLNDDGLETIAIVGTAGTTDAGAIDSLDDLADRAAATGAWLHVDAAVGSAFALSDRLRPLLRGIDRADSITVDLHKLWWQPISASVLLVRDDDMWAGLREPADYLNRTDDHGVLNLVDRSLDTSRRFDALKVLVSLRATGRRRLAVMVEHLVDLASTAGRLVRERPELELLAEPQTVTVLFGCRAADHADDRLTTSVQRHLLATGQAVVGRTRHHNQTALKLTFVNPLATAEDVAALLDLIVRTARELDATASGGQAAADPGERPSTSGSGVIR